MTQFFQDYFQFALEATVIVCIALALRPLFRRYSKRIANLLWVAVFFRLLCPYTAEGPIPAFWENWTAEGQVEQAADLTTVEGEEGISGENGALLAAMDGRGKADFKDPSRSQEAKGAQASLEPKGLQDAQATQDVQNAQGVQVSKETQNYQGIQDGAELQDSQENLGSQGALRNQNTPESQMAQGIESPHGVQTAQDVQNAWEIMNSQGSQITKEPQNSQGIQEPKKPQEVLHSEGEDTKNDVLTSNQGLKDTERKTDNAERKKFSLRSSYAAAALWFQSVAGKSFLNVCGVIWAFGAGVFLLYGIGLYVRLSRKLEEAIPVGAWGKYPIKSSDVSGVPMSFGVLRRGIYVPFYFQEQDGALNKISSKEKEMILHHEAMHLNRLDPLWKLISFLALCLHWWNPVVWLCIRCFHKDLEMACDEGVLSKLGQERRGDYAKALLHFAEQRSGLSMAAAFGESNVESRIKATMGYKKRPVWLSVTLSCLVLLLAGCLATNPRGEGKGETSEEEVASSVENQVSSEEKEPSVQVPDGQELYGAESVTEDGYYVYASNEDLQEGFQERFRDILLEEGSISENDMFFTYRNVEHHENGIAAKRNGEHLSSWPEAICIDPNGLLTQYVARLDYYLEDGKYYLGDVDITDNSKVDNYEKAVLFNTFAGLTDSSLLKQEENVPELFLDSRSTFFDVMADLWKEKDPEKYEKLQDPVTAVTEVMHLQGGKGEVIASQNYGKIVKYTFADGKSVRYRVKKRGEEWMPSSLLEYSKAIQERYPDEWPNVSEQTEEEWLEGLQKTEEYLRTVTATKLRSIPKHAVISAEPCWEGGKEGDFTILDQIPVRDAALYGLYGDGGMVLRVGEKTYPIWLSWASLYHGPNLYAGDYDGDGEVEYALVVITGTGTGVFKEGLYVIELQENEAEVHEFTEFTKYEELAKRLTYEYAQKEKRLTLAIDKGNPSVASYVGLFLEGRLPEDQEDNWLSGPVEIAFGDQERITPYDDNLYYELSGGLIFGAEGAPAWPQYDVSVNLTCSVQYHADGSFTIGKITGEAEYYDNLLRDDNVADATLGEEVVLEQYADLTRDGVKDVIVTSVTYHEENQKLSWKERLNQHESCFVRVYNGAWEGNFDKKEYAATGGYDPEHAIWERELAKAHAGNGMVLLCKKDGRDYLLTGSMGMWQGVLEPEYRVFSLGESGAEYEMETGRTTASVTVPEDVWDVEAMVNYAQKLDAWTKNSTLLALTDVEFDDRIGGRFDASESWKPLYASVQELRDAIEYGEDPLDGTIPDIIALKGMSNLEESLNSLQLCWRKCAERIKYGDNMHRILTDLQPGKNIYTCHLTHDNTPVTVTVDYQDAVEHSSDEILIKVENLDGKKIWDTAVSVKTDCWECYYLTIYEELAYVIQYVPIHEIDGVSEGYFKMFYLNDQGEEQVICECSVSSKDSKDFEKDKAAFEKTKDDHMGKMNLIAGVADGEIAIKQVR